MCDSAETSAAAVNLLRVRLLEVRRDALIALASALPVVDGGLLALIANVSAVLVVIEQDTLRKGAAGL